MSEDRELTPNILGDTRVPAPRTTNAFHILIRAHDHVWNERRWPLDVRQETCHILMQLVIQISKEIPPKTKKKRR